MSKYTQAIDFWSDIRNVENASPEDIKSDILAYLEWLVSAEKKLEAVNQALVDNIQPSPGGVSAEQYRAWLYSTLPFLKEE